MKKVTLIYSASFTYLKFRTIDNIESIQGQINLLLEFKILIF